MTLWRRRAVRQMVLSVIPMLLIAAGVVVVLGAAYGRVAAELRPATATATGTVTTAGTGRDGLSLRWRDATGATHTSRLVFPRTGDVAAGTRVELRYVPGDPERVYAAADAVNLRGRGYFSAMLLAVLILVAGVVVTGYRIARRLWLERRPARTLPVRWASSKRGLIRRSWLVVTDGEREWWQPVYWRPDLPAVLAGTPSPVRGRPGLGRPVVVEVGGEPVWPSGWCRGRTPSGELTENRTAWSASRQRKEERRGEADAAAPRVSLTRHLVGDIGLVLPAPALGLLWAFFDGSGTAGFAFATLLLAGVLFWLPGVFGSDPT